MDIVDIGQSIIQLGVSGVLLWRLWLADQKIADMTAEIRRLNAYIIGHDEDYPDELARKPRLK